MEVVSAKLVLREHTQLQTDQSNVIHVDVVANPLLSLEPLDVLTVKQETSQLQVELVKNVNLEHTLLMMVLVVVLTPHVSAAALNAVDDDDPFTRMSTSSTPIEFKTNSFTPIGKVKRIV